VEGWRPLKNPVPLNANSVEHLDLFAQLPLTHHLRQECHPGRAMKSAIILAYHRIVTSVRGDIADRRLEVSDLAFDGHLEVLTKHFQVVPLLEIVERISVGRPVGGLAAITFDDGYRDVYLNALPILRKRCLPSTIFLVTAPIERNCPFWTDRLAHFVAASASSTEQGQVAIYSGIDPHVRTDPRKYYLHLKSVLSGLGDAEREDILDHLGARNAPGEEPLSWDQAAIMHHAGVEIGVHTHSHPSLPRLSAEAVASEIRTAQRLIEDRLSVAVQTLAYPFGHTNDNIARIVQLSGLRAALKSGSALCSNESTLFLLPRYRVNEQSANEFASALTKLLSDRESAAFARIGTIQRM
jgi:peptidoglycan/xylan/chitin deacetylase (PgdA/CDA1 family)